MGLFNNLKNYRMLHHPFVFDLVRVMLGILIFYKGVMFVSDGSSLNEIIDNSRVGGLAMILEHHVAFTLLAGGILITLGLLTRLAIIFQLPVFIGVLLNPHVKYGLYSVYNEYTFSIFMVLILVVMLIYGSGPYSVDHFLKRSKRIQHSH